MVNANYYIALCARRYAEATRQLASTEDIHARNELTTRLQYLKESAVLETNVEYRGRLLRLPADMRNCVDRRQTIVRVLSSKEIEALRYLYAVPGGGVLGILSSREMMRMADVYEGWSCSRGLDRHSMIQTLGFADSLRSIALFLGPDHIPHNPPAGSLQRFLYERAFLNSGDND